MIALTVQEIRRFYCFILQKTIIYGTAFLANSSHWRRHHQYIAQLCHQKAHTKKYKYNLQL